MDGAQRLRAEAERLSDDVQMREATDRAAKEARKQARYCRTLPAVPGKKPASFTRTPGLTTNMLQRFTIPAPSSRVLRQRRPLGVLKAKGLDQAESRQGRRGYFLASSWACAWGASFPGLDAVLLGSHPHWLTHSALPVWGLKKASEKFDGYLKKQEE